MLVNQIRTSSISYCRVSCTFESYVPPIKPITLHKTLIWWVSDVLCGNECNDANKNLTSGTHDWFGNAEICSNYGLLWFSRKQLNTVTIETHLLTVMIFHLQIKLLFIIAYRLNYINGRVSYKMRWILPHVISRTLKRAQIRYLQYRIVTGKRKYLYKHRI